MSSIEPTIWRYKEKLFSTKIERDMYAQGFQDGLMEGQKKHVLD
jgi:hypothetical protein